MELEIDVPISKSVENRRLLINAMLFNKFEHAKENDCDDIRVMKSGLQKKVGRIDLKSSGTAMRFLTVYHGLSEDNDVILDGSDRLRERPIEDLVTILRSLGANICYDGNPGHLLIKIKNGKFLDDLNKKKIKLELENFNLVTSQYVSGLLIGLSAVLMNDFVIHIPSNMISMSYVDMTFSILKMLYPEMTKTLIGRNLLEIGLEKSKISRKIDSQVLENYFFLDQSSIPYWIAFLAISKKFDKIIFKNNGHKFARRIKFLDEALTLNILEKLSMRIEGNCIIKEHKNINHDKISLDFRQMPDEIMTFAVLFCILEIPYKITGCGSLIHKECDRIQALVENLSKFGYSCKYDMNEESLEYDGKQPASLINQPVEIETFNDHRIAMAFSQFLLISDNAQIDKLDIVSKSYPNFWEEFYKFKRI